jgi:hypothetical protein
MKIGLITVAIVGILVTPVVSSFTRQTIVNNFTAIEGNGSFPNIEDYNFSPFGEHAVDVVEDFFEFWSGTANVIKVGWEGLLDLFSTPTYSERFHLNTGFNQWPQQQTLFVFVKNTDGFTANVIVYDLVANAYKDGTIFLGILMPLTNPWLTNSQMITYKTTYGWPTQPAP